MPKRTHNELLTGLFVLVALAALLGVVLWLGASDLLKPRAQRVSFFAGEEIGSFGLRAGAEVLYGDVRIGRVAEIEPLPGKGCLYHTRIERKDITLYSNALAEVASSLVGQAQLIVKNAGGGPDAKAPDDENPIELKPGGLSAVMNAAGAELDAHRKASLIAKLHAMADDLTDVSSALRKEMDKAKAETLLAKIYDTVSRLADVTDNLKKESDKDSPESLLAKAHKGADRVTDITSQLGTQLDTENEKSLMASLRRSARNVEEITADAKPKFKKAMSALTDTLTELREANTEVLKTIRNLSRFSESAKEAMVVNAESVNRIIDDMTAVAANLKATSKQVRRHPWKLLYKPDEEEVQTQQIYDAARAFSDGATRLNQAVTRLKELRKAHPEGIPADDDQLLQIRQSLKATFGRFKTAEDALWKELAK